MPNYHIPLFPGGLYHVLNRANGDERLFREEANYLYFLNKFNKHISPVAQTLAWCLLPNHYHFLVRIKPVEIIRQRLELLKSNPLADEDLSKFIMQQFSNWQNGYAKAVNKMYNRKGSLFMDYMRRVEVNINTQLGNTVFYIHKNPMHHGFAKTMEQWPWSSYKEYASGNFNVTDSKEVIEWFGTVENFISFHQQPVFKK